MFLKYIEVGCNSLPKAQDIFLSKFDFHLVSQSSTSCKIRRNADEFVLNDQHKGYNSVINIAFVVKCIKQFQSEMMRQNIETSCIKSNCQHYPGIAFIDVPSPLPNLYHRIYENFDGDYQQDDSYSNFDHVLFGCQQLTAQQNAMWYSKLLNLKPYYFKGAESGSMKVVVNGTGMEMFANYGSHLPVFAFSEPIIENPNGKNQIEQFLKANNGGGVQHIAFQTQNILETILQLRNRGVRIIEQPYSYYVLKEKQSDFEKLDLDPMIAYENSIIVDKDADGYLLQAFTESLFDKDGLFIEVIERRGCRGFGAGNIKALFSALQKDKTGEECAASSL